MWTMPLEDIKEVIFTSKQSPRHRSIIQGVNDRGGAGWGRANSRCSTRSALKITQIQPERASKDIFAATPCRENGASRSRATSKRDLEGE